MKNSENDEEQNYIGGIFQRIDSFIVVRGNFYFVLFRVSNEIQ